ncbi:ABC-type oligopeptide transport system ATPase subunit [Bradyrhizobium sp. GM22.5]
MRDLKRRRPCAMLVPATLRPADVRGGRERMSNPLLKVENLIKHYPLVTGFLKKAGAVVRAVEDISFSVSAGETLCIVGESGCGKSTVARLLMRIVEPTGGRVLIEGTDFAGLKTGALRAWRRRMQKSFRTPYSWLNPLLTAGQIITAPLENFGRLTDFIDSLRLARCS